MAVIKPTVVDVSYKGDGSCMQVIWTPVTNADTCAAVSFPEHTDRSIQVSGAFGGTSVAVQGSNNNGATFCSLFDPSSTVIAITTNLVIKAVLENAVLIAPLLTGGAATSITIAMLFHMSNPLRT